MNWLETHMAVILQMATFVAIVASILISVGGFVVSTMISLRNGRKIDTSIEKLDGRLSELLVSRESVAHADGVTEGKAAHK